MINGSAGRKAPLYRRRADTIVSGARAAAAVWKYDTNIEELRIVWLMDDDSEHSYARTRFK